MNQVPLSVRVSEKLKESATNVLRSRGLTTSSAVRVFLTHVVKENGIPFKMFGDNPISKGDDNEKNDYK